MVFLDCVSVKLNLSFPSIDKDYFCKHIRRGGKKVLGQRKLQLINSIFKVFMKFCMFCVKENYNLRYFITCSAVLSRDSLSSTACIFLVVSKRGWCQASFFVQKSFTQTQAGKNFSDIKTISFAACKKTSLQKVVTHSPNISQNHPLQEPTQLISVEIISSEHLQTSE